MRALARRTALIAVLGIGAALAGAPASAEQSVELAVKATYLYKFALFVDWPDGVLGPAGSPVSLCVVGDDPFGRTLDEAVRDQAIRGRPIAVRRLPTATAQSGCHILYAAGSAAQSADEIVAAVRGTGVLTVTEATAPDASTGVISFVIERNRVKFAIDQGAASANGLTISSRLLSLALSVR